MNKSSTLHTDVRVPRSAGRTRAAFPFGETWVQNGGDDKVTPYLYTSKELDSETGLYYFGARYYDPRTSIWQSADPILEKYLPNRLDKKQQEKGFDPMKDLPGMGGVFNTFNTNMYHYSALNPVKYFDPDGNLTLAYQVLNNNLPMAEATQIGGMSENALKAGAVGAVAAGGTIVSPVNAATVAASMAIGDNAAESLSVASVILGGRAAVAHFAKKAGADLLDSASMSASVLSATLDTTFDNVASASVAIGANINNKAASFLKGIQSTVTALFDAALFGRSNSADSTPSPQSASPSKQE